MLIRDEFKYLLYTERLKDIIDKKLINPVCVEIGLTTRCDNKCIFCAFDWLMKEQHIDIDPTVLQSAIDDMYGMGVQGVSICGNGEPLLYRNFVDIVRRIQRYNIDIGLVTNGGLLHKYLDVPEYAKMLAEFTYIRISLDAGDSLTYKDIHGVDRFDLVIENIRRLVLIPDRKVTVGVHYTLCENNKDSLYRAVVLCKNMGVDYFHVGPVVKSTKFSENLPKPYLMYPIESTSLTKNYSNDRFKVFVSDNRFEDISGLDKTTAGYDLCRAQNYFTIIGADGGVYPCCHTIGNPKYCFGNINEQYFKDIWFSEKRKNIMYNIDFKDCSLSCNKKWANRMLHSLFNPLLHPSFLG